MEITMSNTVIQTAEQKMNGAIESLNSSLLTLRAGRANAHILDKVTVDYYGTKTPINQISTIAVPEPRSITIQPYDINSLKEIEKAILKADLGFNPSNDGKIIRLIVPQLTEERRKELVKLTKKYGEECKVSIRNVRRKADQKIKGQQKDNEISEDELHDIQNDIQDLTNKKIKEIDQILKEKEKEILAV
jgi:ribosome recycling factor